MMVPVRPREGLSAATLSVWMFFVLKRWLDLSWIHAMNFDNHHFSHRVFLKNWKEERGHVISLDFGRDKIWQWQILATNNKICRNSSQHLLIVWLLSYIIDKYHDAAYMIGVDKDLGLRTSISISKVITMIEKVDYQYYRCGALSIHLGVFRGPSNPNKIPSHIK